MLTRSWGSWSTTATLMDRLRIADCGMRNCTGGSFAPRPTPLQSAFRIPHSEIVSSHQLQHTHPCYILPVAPHEHPAVTTTPDQLPGAPRAARQHLVHQQVERQPPAHVRALPPPLRPGDTERHAVPALGTLPGAPYAHWIGRAVTRRQDAQPAPGGVGNDQVSDPLLPRSPCLVPCEIHLHAIGVDVVWFVVE